MYVCKKCNQEVEKPKTTIGGKYCPAGHRLLGDSVVHSFWGSFATTFAISFMVSLVVILAVTTNSDTALFIAQRRQHGDPHTVAELNHSMLVSALVSVLIIIFFNSWRAFHAGNKWKERGGAVQKLIPRARGRGFGHLAAAGLLALFLVPGLW
ncbi:MAG TPA: hypothetical protein VJX69_11155 [Terriglobales bacterium]|nr:hypothetical protein [Terriglobales bacterium]